MSPCAYYSINIYIKYDKYPLYVQALKARSVFLAQLLIFQWNPYFRIGITNNVVQKKERTKWRCVEFWTLKKVSAILAIIEYVKI